MYVWNIWWWRIKKRDNIMFTENCIFWSMQLFYRMIKCWSIIYPILRLYYCNEYMKTRIDRKWDYVPLFLSNFQSEPDWCAFYCFAIIPYIFLTWKINLSYSFDSGDCWTSVTLSSDIATQVQPWRCCCYTAQFPSLSWLVTRGCPHIEHHCNAFSHVNRHFWSS